MPACLYSIAYMRNYEGYSVARYYPYLLLFLAAMYGLVSTTDMMWFFFIFWQMMTLPGYALIRYDYRNRNHIRAANKYLLMMQIACAATMVGAEVLAVTSVAARGSVNLMYDFDTVSSNLPLLLSTRPQATALAFAREVERRAPHDALELDGRVVAELSAIRDDQEMLQGFFHASELPIPRTLLS